ncbi:hypothetical protein [Magnetospirillum fulvum]|uniref:Uncharacterized protein n=1 Tax=Magnetospirillum fulvum MGU-K5 TaxID=1316936 RepID=S9TJC2_MAGFU|nr:hypothetical protein [Magnetospirillum fulvum]EPY02346.1 hypothetical protein K678_06245 [Magnetospirillum fulvum MGU-K5]
MGSWSPEEIDKAVSMMGRFTAADTMAGLAQNDLDLIHSLLERRAFRFSAPLGYRWLPPLVSSPEWHVVPCARHLHQ